MVWQMNTKNKDTVKDALVYFEKKYGKPPTSIICNPEVTIEADIPVHKYHPVLANLLFIGEIENETQVPMDLEASKN